jgi:hypothetical protein
MGRHGPDCCGSGYGKVTSFCECGHEPSGSMECGVFRV